MGRKTDVKAIFQIGKNNNSYAWDSKYFEKKKEESNIFIFQSVEIKEFIKKKLKDNGLILNTCKIKYLESTLKIFVSYLKLSNSSNIRPKRNRKIRLVKNRYRKEGIKKSVLKIKKQIKIYRKIKKYFELKKIHLDLTISQKRELKKEAKKAKIKRFLYILKIAKNRSKNRKILFKKLVIYKKKKLSSIGQNMIEVKKIISKVTRRRLSMRTRIGKVEKIIKLMRELNYIKSVNSIKRVRRFAKLSLRSPNVTKLKKKRLRKFISQLRRKSHRVKRKFVESTKRSPTKFLLKLSSVTKFQKKRLLKFISQLRKDRRNLQRKFRIKLSFVMNCISRLYYVMKGKRDFRLTQKIKQSPQLEHYYKQIKLFRKSHSPRTYHVKVLKKCRFKMKQELILKVIKKFILINRKPNKKRNVYYYLNYVNFKKKRLKKKLVEILIAKKKLSKYIFQPRYGQTVENKKKMEKQTRTNRIIKNKKTLKKRIRILQYYKYYVAIKNSKIVKNMKTNNFLQKLIESLKIFTNNKFKILLNFQQVNKNLNYQLNRADLSHFRSILARLRRFKRNNYFKEGVHTIFFFVIGKKSLHLLSNFISSNLTLNKKHRFFLRFLTQTLSIMLKSKWSKIKSVKIIISGRFFGRSRSSERTITVNKNISFTKLKSNINFSKTTAYGSDGTFGVKIWVNEK